MAQRRQVLCVVQRDRPNPHERITHVGGRTPEGLPWRMSQQSAIDAIEADVWSFFVAWEGREQELVVVVSRYGRKYLKTPGDGDSPDQLLRLPTCP
ncbi:MAG: DUF3892 domain-containing protein [Gemmatimonadales bacterium]